MPDKKLINLLYVDDDANLRAMAEIALKNIGRYTVEVCDSGATALEILQRFTPDMIVLDMIMPDMDGLETLAKIREIAVLKATPVIFLTAHSNMQQLAAFKQAGAIDVIIKPFNPMQLAGQVQTLWNKYG